MKFKAILETFGENSLGYGVHIKIPDVVFSKIINICPDKRVVCIINSNYKHHCAMMPNKTYHFIMFNKQIIKSNNLNFGEEITIELKKEDSKYGLPISEELEEVLFSDPEGSVFFHKLTAGKQRTLIHIINKIKNSQLKIERSFVILEHLKKMNGQLDYQILKQDFIDFKNKMTFN
jgi:hypothetical protein